jgi:hypothetical protein
MDKEVPMTGVWVLQQEYNTRRIKQVPRIRWMDILRILFELFIIVKTDK